MSRFEEINKIVDEMSDADTLFEFAEKVYDSDQQIADLQHKLEVAEIALELMRVDYLGMYCSDYCGHGGKCKKCEYEERTSIETYKEQAEKEVKGWKE